MKTPPLLLGAALIFWGWQTGLWIFAIPMAAIIEGARFFPSRWEFSGADFRRMGNLCLIILIFLTIYLLIRNPSFYFVYTLLQWLPVILFPLLAAQTYSVNENIDITKLFLLFNDEITTDKNQRFTVDISYLYLASCILSASNANVGNISFYCGMFVLSAVGLWSLRSKRFSPMVWLCFLLTAGSIGFIGQIGLHQLHLTVEDRVAALYGNAMERETNSSKKQTNIGDIGLLKQSNEIIFRVATEGQKISDLLLREATYNKYQASLWVASKSNFIPVQSDRNGTSWRLANSVIKDLTPQPPSLAGKGENSNNISLQERGSTITVSATLHGGQGLLTLPNGTFQLDELPVSQMEKNKYGAVKVVGKVDAIAYQIQFNKNLSFDSLPTEDDLQIPKQEKPALDKIISQLDIKGKSPSEVLNRVDRFFIKNFTYSLKLANKENSSMPLSIFLLQTRAGHCEYFATATTLLLRAAGIPARYAVGYSVHEYSPLEKQYIIRNRHAHAWTMVYLNGKWQAFDTTPADWNRIEDATASRLSFISDLWSFLSFKISHWLSSSDGLKYGWVLIFVLVYILVWRFIRQTKVRRLSRKERLAKSIAKSEQNKRESEFYLIEKALNELGYIRQPSESLKIWIARLKEEIPTSDLIEELSFLIELHYRDRFDPLGIKDEERAILSSKIRAWLEKYKLITHNL
ncbi:MAG TPA: transglutaminase domain-containing protein [Leptolyngbyaceae cyanobacterium]